MIFRLNESFLGNISLYLVIKFFCSLLISKLNICELHKFPYFALLEKSVFLESYGNHHGISNYSEPVNVCTCQWERQIIIK